MRLDGTRAIFARLAHGVTAAANGQYYQFSREAQITFGGKA
jgi:hypothetical protein